jgi:deoxyinosine 3'endonuclease (endonuclease V)
MNGAQTTAGWVQEQLEVARKVIVRPNAESKLTTTAVCGCDNNKPSNRFVPILVNQPMNDVANSKCYYGGVDVSFPLSHDEEEKEKEEKHDNDIIESRNKEAVAVYVVLEYPTMNIVYTAHQYYPVTVPYIPSFLAFREIEPIASLIQTQLFQHPHCTPSVILVDGNGLFHPRNAGLACFVGIRTGIPTIGIGKTLYCTAGTSKAVVHGRIGHSIRQAISLVSSIQHDSHLPESNGDALQYTLTIQQFEHAQQNVQALSSSSSLSDIVLFDCDVDHPSSVISKESYSCSANDEQNKDLRQYTDTNVSYPVNEEDRSKAMKALRQICIGLAIPIVGDVVNPSHDCCCCDCKSHSTILAYALVGHGGRHSRPCCGDGTTTKQQRVGRTANQNNTVVGTGNPIYVSIGHNISLQDAVVICSKLSYTRIPEPIRQADLLGRELLRQRN